MMQLGASLTGKFISFSPNATFLKDVVLFSRYGLHLLPKLLYGSKLLLIPIAWDLSLSLFHATMSLNVPDKAKQTF